MGTYIFIGAILLGFTIMFVSDIRKKVKTKKAAPIKIIFETGNARHAIIIKNCIQALGEDQKIYTEAEAKHIAKSAFRYYAFKPDDWRPEDVEEFNDQFESWWKLKRNSYV